MPHKIANTVLITTKCSGGCQHCPFSSASMKELFLTRESIIKILKKANGNLTILSGGEPFEHPEIADILKDLSEQANPFRIATGGFIDLNQWVGMIKLLHFSGGPLQGISIGTDVLSSRVNHSKWIQIWINNIFLLAKHQIPYSLTFTLGNDLDFSKIELWKWKEPFRVRPEFIYLRYSEGVLPEELILKIQDAFGNIPIVKDGYL